MQRFIGRTHELNTLDRLWQQDSAALLIVYGRRRVGKTHLLTHWLTQQPTAQALYWVAQPSSPTEQLRQFSQALYRFENPTGVVSETYSYQSWQQAFEQVGRMAEQKRLVLILDEFTYLLARTPELAGLLQNTWDHSLSSAICC